MPPTVVPFRGTIQLPPLHPGQVDIGRSSARFKVVVCGRRFGKTTYGVRENVKGALETGGIYWWIGPSYKIADIGWEMLKLLARQIPDVQIREADKEVIFANGGKVCVRSAVDPDSLRGEKLSGVVFDEFPLIKEYTWTEVIRPALADMKGWALFIGTPKGKNWGYRLFEAAKSRTGWEAFKKPTSANPYIDPGEIEAARQEMTEEQFKQEFEADFGASQYLVYPEVMPEIHEWKGQVPKFISYHGAMDFGGDSIGSHKSSIVISGRTEKDELIIFAAFEESGPNIGERMVNWTLEKQSLISGLQKEAHMPPTPLIFRGDKTQMLGIQFMRGMGISIFPTRGGRDSVNEGIELVHRRLKSREIDGKPRLFWLKGTPYVGEALMRYRYPDPFDNEDRMRPKNPLKVDDDTVDTIRYMVEGVDAMVIGNPQEMYRALIPGVR